jgi:hypothetical protein
MKSFAGIYFITCLFFLCLRGSPALAQVPDSFPSPLTPRDRPINIYLLNFPLNFKDGFFSSILNQSISCPLLRSI